MESVAIRRVAASVLIVATLGGDPGPLAAETVAKPPPGMLSVVVPRAALYPGDALVDGLLEEKQVRANADYAGTLLLSREQVAGLVARRTLLPGQPIPKDAVRRAHVVEQGRPVLVRYVDGPISIVLSGTALQAGAPGDTIAVRNGDSGRVIRGQVVDARTVAVRAP